MRIENVAVAERRVAAGQPTLPLLGVSLLKDRWRAEVWYQSKQHYLGSFDREEEAGREVDWALASLFDRPGDVNYDDAGERTGNDPRRHQVAVRTANLVGNANQESDLIGVSKNKTKVSPTLSLVISGIPDTKKEVNTQSFVES
jgi:hypothetical protein